MVEFMVIASIWESMAAWLTPSVLFCVTNLIIATIFIASNKHHHHLHANGDSNSFTPIARVSSFLERARSMNLSSYTTGESQHQYQSQSKSASYSSSSPLAQSIHFSSNSVTSPALSESEGWLVSQPVLAPSLFERVKSFKFSFDYNEKEFPVQSGQIPNSPGELVRSQSLLDRVKSLKRLSATFKSGTDPSHNHPEHHVIRSKSEKTSEKKSSVEVRNDDVDLPATTRRNEFDEEVDAKADDFITRFKQQLKLQRLESLVRYNEMSRRR